MRLSLDPRGRRLLQGLPPVGAFGIVEAGLIALLAVQCARLAWIALTPVAPDAAPLTGAPPGMAAAPAGDFDPFFRLAPAASGPVQVTGLDLSLHGVRQDGATGRGSAIVGTPDGRQRSFEVGEEIMPGVVLKQVEFDHVTITREGRDEQLFMDQSGAAEVVGPGAEGVEAGPPPPERAPPPPPGATLPPPQVAPPPVVRQGGGR